MAFSTYNYNNNNNNSTKNKMCHHFSSLLNICAA